MRFGIRHLLLLAPLFLLNTFLISVFALPPLRTYRYQHEVNGIRHAQDWVETSIRYCSYENLTVTDETIGEWLAHRLPSTNPAAQVLMEPPRMDSWGNPYRIQARENADSKLRVYSTGRDGMSKTDGNDPDDIRSWDDERGEWYRNWQYRREIGGCMALSVFVTPFVFWGLIKLTSTGKRPPDTSAG